MEWFDTHTHLAANQFSSSRSAVVNRANAAGVTRMLCVGTTRESSQESLAIAKAFAGVVASAGIHPCHTHEAAAGDWDEVVRLAEAREVVALGETGLDLYWKEAPLEVQQDYFDRHLRHMQKTGLPVIVHVRETMQETYAMLVEARKRGPVSGVIHSFSGNWDEAQQFLELGMHLGFSGMVTYKKNRELHEVARKVPGDRLLLETDAPYLSPEPKRSVRPNESALMVHTAAFVAQQRGIDLAELSRMTMSTSEKLFSRRT